MNICPKCNKEGIYWDGRAKILLCPWTKCNHIIRNIPEWKHKAPTEKEIKEKLKIKNPINSRFEILDIR